MTHDEMLAKIVNYPDTILFVEYYRALRAVVELHKPDNDGDCSMCLEWPIDRQTYPCSTIQAIEKELE